MKDQERPDIVKSKGKDFGPTCSIIIPVYNSEPYLEDCIRSVLNQTFTNYELILIDDGSSDKSREIPWYDENRIFYIGIEDFLLNEGALGVIGKE